jgi:hypothetical protein
VPSLGVDSWHSSVRLFATRPSVYGGEFKEDIKERLQVVRGFVVDHRRMQNISHELK